MSSHSVSFEDLDNEFEAPKPDSVKRGIEIKITVAGKADVERKTVQLKLDQRGLIELSFKEGGELPELLKGRFTNLTEVKLVLALWQERRAREFNLDESIQHPHASDKRDIGSLVDSAVDKGALKFEAPALDGLQADSVVLDDSEE